MMRRVIAILLMVVAAGMSLLAQKPAPAPAAPADAGFDVQRVAPDVYALIRKEPPGVMLNANSVVIVNAEDVVVIDTGIGPSAAKAIVAAVRTITAKPVKYVVNTHWHDDHVLGNQVFRETFKDVQFIGHARAQKQLDAVGAASRKQLDKTGPMMTQQLRISLEQSKSMAGGPISDEERRSYTNDIAALERFVAEASATTVVMPTMPVEDKLTLVRGRRTIDILHLGAGHTSEDLVVWLPQDRVMATGDLVVTPVPLLVSSSRPADFVTTLEKLAALQPQVLIPGHGPVENGLGHVRLETRVFSALVEQVRTLAAKGASLPETRKAVNLSEFEKMIAGDSSLLRQLFSFRVTGPGVSAAYRDATAPAK
jgi:glyoxylase-like metal-dependent hydrolase (beta-lactamase superfamily II)